MNIRKTFKANCGAGVVYLNSSLGQRSDHNVVIVQFEMVPDGKRFNLDGVIHGPGDEELRKAVLKIADIAKNIRTHIAPERKREFLNGH